MSFSVRYLSTYLVFTFFLLLRLPPASTLFPYTTLFRSGQGGVQYLSPDQIEEDVDPLGAVLLQSGLARGRFEEALDRKSTRLNSSHGSISYAVFCLKKKKTK